MPEREFSQRQTLTFVFIVCLTCAVVLSLLATLLQKPQSEARQLYRNKQMLIAARLLSSEGGFLLDGKPAQFVDQKLVPSQAMQKAKESEILSFCDLHVQARLTDASGQIYTFQELNLDQTLYLEEHQKLGYSQLPYKLIYLIDWKKEALPYSYVIPINGYGLWDAIYGFLALESDANTVLGTTWYDQKETPGLGAEIGGAEWQAQFFDKVIFQESDNGSTDFARAPLGFKIVKTSVADELGDRPIARSAVDGVTGASATMRGVTEAYRDCLAPYRPFLLKAHQTYLEASHGGN